MIFDLRGTNGAGKSTIIRRLLSDYGNVPLFDKQRKVVGHEIPGLQAAVVGPYVSRGVGCDAVRNQNVIEYRLRAFKKRYPVVLLEGAIVSHIYARYATLAREVDYTFVFLDTPYEVCLERIERRRAQQGKPMKTMNHLAVEHPRIHVRLYNRLRREGFNVQQLDHRKAYDELVSMIKEIQ